MAANSLFPTLGNAAGNPHIDGRIRPSDQAGGARSRATDYASDAAPNLVHEGVDPACESKGVTTYG